MFPSALKTYGKAILKQALPEKAWNRLLLGRMRKNISSYSARTVRHVYGGHALDVRLADRVAEDWYDKDWPTLPEIELLSQSKLKPGARVFDVGAHQAVVAMMIGKTVGPTGAVIAVEANPHNARIAQTNCGLNHLAQVKIVQRAVSDRRQTIAFNEDVNGQVDETGSLGRIEVEAYTVDDLTQEFGKPDVLFLDIEGFETQALAGAKSTLAARPDCFIEVHVGTGLEKFGGSVEGILAYFPVSNYQLFVGHPHDDKEFKLLDRGSPSPITKDLMSRRFHLVALAR
jgi:FkbM family methyltransferase